MTTITTNLQKKIKRYLYVILKLDGFRRNRMIRARIYHLLPVTRKIHSFFCKRKIVHLSEKRLLLTNKIVHECFLTAIPHVTTGIGHAFAEWNTGRIIAKVCNLEFVHVPLPDEWESFLMLGSDTISIEQVLKRPNLKIIKLPYFDYKVQDPYVEISKLINSCQLNYPALFILADGQNLYQHDFCLAELKSRYFSLHSSFNNLKEYNSTQDAKSLNVAVHIRRGDVELMRINHEGNWEERYVELNYFQEILQMLGNILNEYNLNIHVYSQGEEKDFLSLSLKNVKLFINYNQYETMNRMIFSDILVLSPSGFSFMAGLISNGFKLAKYPWWHNIPEDEDWCRVSNKPSDDYENIANKLKQFLTQKKEAK